ncbi:hypothetical protein [Polaribacter sp.]|uniref:hypothetical protein n=1 Tax=Polaribacter sp. TaxID=1920175 RepID=UPI003F6C7A98
MKTIKNQFLVVFTFITLFTNAQENLMTLGTTSANIDLPSSEQVYDQTPMIYNQSFTYNYKRGKVLVYFNSDEHIEYFNNKEYYIKSDIVWINKDECIITLKEITLPDFPFRPGNSLKMKITEIKGDYVYYESTLGGRTWEGKMKQVETAQEEVIASN